MAGRRTSRRWETSPPRAPLAPTARLTTLTTPVACRASFTDQGYLVGAQGRQQDALAEPPGKRAPCAYVRTKPSSSLWAKSMASSIDLPCCVHWATILQIVP